MWHFQVIWLDKIQRSVTMLLQNFYEIESQGWWTHVNDLLCWTESEFTLGLQAEVSRVIPATVFIFFFIFAAAAVDAAPPGG